MFLALQTGIPLSLFCPFWITLHALLTPLHRCWVYRCHRRMEDLLKEDSFNNMLKETLQKAKRGTIY